MTLPPLAPLASADNYLSSVGFSWRVRSGRFSVYRELGTLDLRDYVRVLRKYWVLVVVASLVGLGAGAFLSLASTPQYKSTTRLWVSVRADEGTGVGDLTQGSNFVRQSVTSYVDVVTSALVMDEVAAQLGGNASELASRVSASSPANSVLIDISAVGEDPAATAELANVTGDAFSNAVMNVLERPSEGSPARVQIDTIQPAVAGSAPVSPNVTRNLALGLVGGLGSGVVLAVLLSLLDTRIRSRSDIRSITGVPIMGSIQDDPGARRRPLIIQEDPHSPRAEAYRALRTNLQFLNVEGDPRSFVVTSCGPGEGKTTTTVNLALALAETGARVAVVDGDLRKPKVSDYLGIEGAIGLTDILIGEATFEDTLQQWGLTSLFVLPAGTVPPNPSELLGSRAMMQVMDTLKSHFDYVLVDAPPVLVVTDAAVVAHSTSGVLMVSASGHTRKHDLGEAIELVDSVNARLLGIIMTMVPTKGPDARRYGSYGYGKTPVPPISGAPAPTGEIPQIRENFGGIL